MSAVRGLLRWLGIGGMGLGGVLIVTDLALRAIGLSPSYNLGDPSKFEFYLVSLWHIGAGILVIGTALLATSRRVG